MKEYKRRGSKTTHVISISYIEEEFIPQKYIVCMIGFALLLVYIRGRPEVRLDMLSKSPECVNISLLHAEGLSFRLSVSVMSFA
jgi:hypothetical protein